MVSRCPRFQLLFSSYRSLLPSIVLQCPAHAISANPQPVLAKPAFLGLATPDSHKPFRRLLSTIRSAYRNLELAGHCCMPTSVCSKTYSFAVVLVCAFGLFLDLGYFGLSETLVSFKTSCLHGSAVPNPWENSWCFGVQTESCAKSPPFWSLNPPVPAPVPSFSPSKTSVCQPPLICPTHAPSCPSVQTLPKKKTPKKSRFSPETPSPLPNTRTMYLCLSCHFLLRSAPSTWSFSTSSRTLVLV